jgi:hypothetical protein
MDHHLHLRRRARWKRILRLPRTFLRIHRILRRSIGRVAAIALAFRLALVTLR